MSTFKNKNDRFDPTSSDSHVIAQKGYRFTINQSFLYKTISSWILE